MGYGLAAITQGWSSSSLYQQLLTLGWVPDDASGEDEGGQAAHVLVESLVGLVSGCLVSSRSYVW